MKSIVKKMAYLLCVCAVWGLFAHSLGMIQYRAVGSGHGMSKALATTREIASDRETGITTEITSGQLTYVIYDADGSIVDTGVAQGPNFTWKVTKTH